MTKLRCFLRFWVRLSGGLNEWVGRAVSWLTTMLVVAVCYLVLVRYVFGHLGIPSYFSAPQVAVQEVQWHLFSIIFLLGAGYTLWHDRHVRVDILYARLSIRKRAWIDLVGTLLFLLPFAMLVIWFATPFALRAFSLDTGSWLGERSSNPGGLPGRGLLKAAIPLGFLLLFIQGTASVAAAILTLLGDPPPRPPPDAVIEERVP